MVYPKNKEQNLYIPEERLKKFWENVEKKENGCWEWKAGKCKGYGRFKINNIEIKAHRISYLLKFKKLRHGLLILHKCNNRSCVNPDHLYEGNPKDNMDDRRRAGGFDNYALGEECPSSKLINNDIRQIRKMLDFGLSAYKIAELYKISPQTVYDIKNKKAWGHVE